MTTLTSANSSNRLLSNEDFNTQPFLTFFSKTERRQIINQDLIQQVFSFLSPQDLCTANLINKACYVVYHTPHLKAFDWIFSSSVIRQQELKHPYRLLQFDDGSCSLLPFHRSLEVSPDVLVMDRYVKRNYWKQLIDLFSSSKELIYTDIVNQCRLAADQGHEPAIKHFIELYFSNCFESTAEDDEAHKEFLTLIYQYADRGSESAIRFILAYFSENEDTCSKTQIERLNLIKKYAERGSEAAIKYLLNSFCTGRFEIDIHDEKMQELCLKTAHRYIKKFRSEAAIKFVLKSYKKSRLGFNWNEIHVQDQCIQFAKTHAALKSETAIAFLLEMHKKQFKLFQTKEIQQEALLLAEDYAHEFRSEVAISFLLEAHDSKSLGLANSLERRKKRNLLAQKYADNGSEAAVKFLLHSKNINNRHEMAQKYAALKSEKAIKYLLKAKFDNHFSYEPITEREGWQLAITYLKRGSLAAFKIMIHAYQIEFD